MTFDRLTEVFELEPEEDWRDGWWMALLAGGCGLVLLSLLGLFIIGCVRLAS